MIEYTKEQTIYLRNSIRREAATIAASDADTAEDVAELLRVLARMVEGKSIHDAFGAPGDWGYENPVGRALSELYKCEAST